MLSKLHLEVLHNLVLLLISFILEVASDYLMRIIIINCLELLLIYLSLLLQELWMLLLLVNSHDLLLLLILKKATEKLTSYGKGDRFCPLHSVKDIWLRKMNLLMWLILLFN